MQLSSPKPNLMVGVPSGYLSPLLPFPKNVDQNVSVGVEIAPGLGISLDGKTLLVGAEGHQGRTEVIGHLKDGTMPQRDTVVLRDGESTTVDGHYSWQDYQLRGKAQHFQADGEPATRGFSVSPTEDGFRVNSPQAARAWTVKANEGGFSVVSDFAQGETFQVGKQGNVTTVDSNLPDQDFTITAHASGAAVIDGNLKTEDFTWTPQPEGYELQGHHDQQHFAIRLS